MKYICNFGLVQLLFHDIFSVFISTFRWTRCGERYGSEFHKGRCWEIISAFLWNIYILSRLVIQISTFQVLWHCANFITLWFRIAKNYRASICWLWLINRTLRFNPEAEEVIRWFSAMSLPTQKKLASRASQAPYLRVMLCRLSAARFLIGWNTGDQRIGFYVGVYFGSSEFRAWYTDSASVFR